MTSGRGTPEYRGPLSARSELSLLINRVECLVLPGIIRHIDYDAAYARVEMKDQKGNGILTDWLRWTEDTAGDDREWSPPSVGELVCVVSPTGNLNNGYIDRSVHTTAYPPNCASPTIRRKTWGKKPSDSFFDYPFWELEKTKGKTHVWEYLPSKGEFRHEIGDKVLVHWTEDFLMWRIGNTQYVFKDGSAVLTIADDLKNPKETTEIRADLNKVEVHANHEAAVIVNRSGGALNAPAKVEMQVGGLSTVIVEKESVKASVGGDACLSLTRGNAILEVKNSKAKLELKTGMSSLSLDGISCTVTPLSASLGMNGSVLEVMNAIISANTSVLRFPALQPGAAAGIGFPYVTGPVAATPHPTVSAKPQQAKPRWQLSESKGPYYPRTKKPKQ